MNFNSKILDSILDKIDDINSSLNNVLGKMNKNMTSFNKGLQASNKSMKSLEKTSSSIVTNLRMGAIVFAAMAASKAKDVLNQYGGAAASFRAITNKSNKRSDMALNRAFKSATGDEQQALQSSLGKFASRGTVVGSQEQQLLLQSGIDPKAFSNMSQIERLNTLMKMYEERGNDINFLKQIEDITNLGKGDLDALQSKLSDINKVYAEQSKTLANINMKGFEDINSSWDSFIWFIQDSLARLFNMLPNLTKELEPFINAFKNFISYFTNSKEGSEYLKELTRYFGNVWEIIKRLVTVLGNALGPVLEKIAAIMKPFIKFLADITEPAMVDKAIDGFNNVIESIKRMGNIISMWFENVITSFKIMFEYIKLSIFQALDYIPGFSYDKEIDESNKKIMNYKKQLSENDINEYINKENTYNSYNTNSSNNIVVQVETNDVSRINNTSARIISQ